MSTVELVAAARAGDRQAFTRLVELHSAMAFGLAVAMLGDYQLAEDATQEAFVAAHFGLPGLRDDAAFPGWLRGIVRNQCLRVIRRKSGVHMPLDAAHSLADVAPGPNETLARAEMRERVLRAVMALPPEQREVVTLYYIGSYSQREVAAFLDLPASTINNRLHAARQRLKGGLLKMVRDDLRNHAPGDQLPQRIGRVIAARGPVVDADFGDEQAPGPLDSLALGDAVSLAVVQRLGGGLVRCVTLDRGEPIEPGMSVRYTGRVIERPMGVEVLQQALGVLLEGHEPGRSVVETGIKAVDLLCPIPSAGVVGLYGPAGAGKLVMLGELIHRLRQGDYPLALLDFTQADTVPTLPTDVSRPVDSGRVDAVYLPVGDAASPHSAAVQQARDAIQGAIYLSREMALSGLYPAIDPLVTWSSLLTADVVGPEHVEVAQQVRDRLSAAPDSESARRLRLFLTQPFFTTEEYTKLPGEYVSLQQTLEGCRAILSGSMDQLPADAFHFTGTLDQVHRKAKR